MKPIHKIAGKDSLRPTMNYIKVKAGYAYCTNAHSLIKMPLSEFLPIGIISSEEELYFLGSDVEFSKMCKAASIERDGLTFTAFDKSRRVLGVLKAKSAEEFKDVGRYPDYDAVLPKSTSIEIEEIGINAKTLAETCSAFGAPDEDFIFTFYGKDKIIKVEHLQCKAVGYCMPLDLEVLRKEAN